MARDYGQIMSAIWNDAEFRALTAAAQRAYLMLVTQHDISSAGTLPLTLNRWAGYAIDTPSDALSDALSELEAKRYIILDREREELLVRKFVKWDRGYSNEKRRAAITQAANSALSPRIRAALAIELDALGVSHALSDTPSDTRRVVVTEDELDPQPLNQNQEPAPIPAASGPPPKFCQAHMPAGTSEPCRACARARETLAQWELAEAKARRDANAARLRAERQAAQAAIRACELCDYRGYRLLAGGRTGAVCNHQPLNPGGLARAQAALKDHPPEETPK